MESTSTTDTENPFKYCGEYVDEEEHYAKEYADWLLDSYAMTRVHP